MQTVALILVLLWRLLVVLPCVLLKWTALRLWSLTLWYGAVAVHWTLCVGLYGSAGFEAAWVADRWWGLLTWPVYVLTGAILGAWKGFSDVHDVRERWLPK